MGHVRLNYLPWIQFLAGQHLYLIPLILLLDIVANALTKLYVVTQAYLKAYNVPFQCQLQDR